MSDLTITGTPRTRFEPAVAQATARPEPATPDSASSVQRVAGRSPMEDSLWQLRGRSDELSGLMKQPASTKRLATAGSTHLFLGSAQAVTHAMVVENQKVLTVQDSAFEPLSQTIARLGAELRHVTGIVTAGSSRPMANDPPSFQDILDGLQDLIGTIRDDYLDVYARLVEKYAQLFSEFNTKILAELHKWTSAVGDKGEIELNAGALRNALNGLIQKYAYPNDAAVLFPEPGQGASKEDAEKWLKAMGLPASSLVDRGDGTFCVVLDLGPLKSMVAGLPSGGVVKLSAAAFQAWQTAFNAQQQEMESTLQKFTQKYSNANAIHDNVQKTISSTLSSLFDMLKAFAASLGA